MDDVHATKIYMTLQEITSKPKKRVRRTKAQIEADNGALKPKKRVRRTKAQIEADNGALKPKKEFSGIRTKLEKIDIEITWDSRQWKLKINNDGPYFYPKLSSLYSKLVNVHLQINRKDSLLDPQKLRAVHRECLDFFSQLYDSISSELDVVRKEKSKD
jgi:hypothetical protein